MSQRRNFDPRRRIIATMRTWLLILMIALLPLRGWASGAMALSMQPSQAPSHAAVPCHGGVATLQSTTMVMDSHHDASVNLADDGSGEDGSLLHNTCSACDVCNGPALTQTFDTVQLAGPVMTLLSTRIERFVSALAKRSHKPPIA